MTLGQLCARACVRLGLSSEEFWEATPLETELMAEEHGQVEREEHERLAFFFAHLITTTGNFKKVPKLKHVFEQLCGREWHELKTPEDLETLNRMADDARDSQQSSS